MASGRSTPHTGDVVYQQVKSWITVVAHVAYILHLRFANAIKR